MYTCDLWLEDGQVPTSFRHHVPKGKHGINRQRSSNATMTSPNASQWSNSTAANQGRSRLAPCPAAAAAHDTHAYLAQQ